MNYYSLNTPTHPKISFKEAVIRGQAPDKGLYFPESLPVFSKDFIAHIHQLSKEELAVEVMRPYVGEDIPEDELLRIITETVNFPFPLVPVTPQIKSLELFHGPTYAFKDVGARFMSRCLGYFHQDNSKKTTILVATSGDTGGAVASGFLGVEGVEVIILYPSGKVSPVQELQLTTLGQNITALEVAGNFDDCQSMVKEAFMDAALQEKYQLTSANSINVGRWLPQQLYYFFALQNWTADQAPVISVPSGNFGNICAGLLAFSSGLPVKHFIAACNANDTVPAFMATGKYQPKKSVATISNAMDVGSPSNFGRIMELFGGKLESLQNSFSSVSVDDQTTKKTIKQVYQSTGYLLDPHGAVAYRALEDYLESNPQAGSGFILETAHPVKFPGVIEDLLDIKIPMPSNAQPFDHASKHQISMKADFKSLKQWMLER